MTKSRARMSLLHKAPKRKRRILDSRCTIDGKMIQILIATILHNSIFADF
jgi:hypothetical protein